MFFWPHFMLFHLHFHCFGFVYFSLLLSFLLFFYLFFCLFLLCIFFLLFCFGGLYSFLLLLLFFGSFLGSILCLLFIINLNLYLNFLIDVFYFFFQGGHIDSDVQIYIFDISDMNWTHHKLNYQIRLLSHIIVFMFLFPLWDSLRWVFFNYFFAHIHCDFYIFLVVI